MLKWLALGIFAALCAATVNVAPAVAEADYTDEQLKQAREFIAETFTIEKKAFLEDLAMTFHKSPEAMFLDISKRTGDATLGTGGNRQNNPGVSPPSTNTGSINPSDSGGPSANGETSSSSDTSSTSSRSSTPEGTSSSSNTDPPSR